MKLRILTTFILFSAFSNILSQSEKKYEEIDALINTYSIIDAMNAIKKLKANHQSDTVTSEYWVRFSRASLTFLRYEDAKLSIEKAIKLDPNNAQYYFEKGILYNAIEEFETSMKSLEKAISIKPNGEYFFYKAIVNYQLKNFQGAESDYQIALDMNYKSPEIYTNFAILLSENGKNEEALTMINQAINLKKRYPQSYSVKSKIHFFLLNIDSACDCRKTVLKMGNYGVINIPDSICYGSFVQKMHYAGDNFLTNNLFKEAINAYSKLIDNNFLKSDYFLNRGYCYYKIDSFEKAEKDYLIALTLPNTSTDLIYNNLGLLYYDIDNFQKSIEYSTKQIELNPRNHVPYIDRGLCYRKLKKYKEAEKDFNKSLEIKPDFFRAFGYRAFLFLELGQYQKSFEDASKSVEINPEYGYGYIVLAQAKRKLGLPNFCIDLYKAKKYGEPEAEMAIKENCK